MRQNPNSYGFFASIFRSLLATAGRLIVAFCIGTGAAALACLYYNVPLAFALLGGFIVLGVAVALMAGSDLF